MLKIKSAKPISPSYAVELPTPEGRPGKEEGTQFVGFLLFWRTLTAPILTPLNNARPPRVVSGNWHRVRHILIEFLLKGWWCSLWLIKWGTYTVGIRKGRWRWCFSRELVVRLSGIQDKTSMPCSGRLDLFNQNLPIVARTLCLQLFYYISCSLSSELFVSQNRVWLVVLNVPFWKYLNESFEQTKACKNKNSHLLNASLTNSKPLLWM